MEQSYICQELDELRAKHAGCLACDAPECGSGKVYICGACEARWQNKQEHIYEFVKREREKRDRCAVAELRRLTPGWIDGEMAHPIAGIVRVPNVGTAAGGHCCSHTPSGSPRTQQQLLDNIDAAQPWTGRVAIEVAKTLLVGWTFADGNVSAPDWQDLGSNRSGDWVSLPYDGRTRLTLIKACEHALASYKQRHTVATGATAWPGFTTKTCSACGAAHDYDGRTLCEACLAVWTQYAEAMRFRPTTSDLEAWCRNQWAAHHTGNCAQCGQFMCVCDRASPSGAPLPQFLKRWTCDRCGTAYTREADQSCICPACESKLDAEVAASAESAAPTVTLVPCSDCGAKLRPDQQHHAAVGVRGVPWEIVEVSDGPIFCRGCSVRAKPTTGAEAVILTDRIDPPPPLPPRDPWDWDPEDAEYEVIG